jgi:hypothetical protein
MTIIKSCDVFILLPLLAVSFYVVLALALRCSPWPLPLVLALALALALARDPLARCGVRLVRSFLRVRIAFNARSKNRFFNRNNPLFEISESLTPTHNSLS